VNSLTTLAKLLMVVHFPKFGTSNASFLLDICTCALKLFKFKLCPLWAHYTFPFFFFLQFSFLHL
jgi:hypothetical protein